MCLILFHEFGICLEETGGKSNRFNEMKGMRVGVVSAVVFSGGYCLWLVEQAWVSFIVDISRSSTLGAEIEAFAGFYYAFISSPC